MVSIPFANGYQRTKADSLPPHSRDAERSWLSSIIRDGAGADIFGQVPAQAHYIFAHQKIAEAIETLHERRQAIDIIAVAELLRDRGQIVDVGGVGYLAELVDAAPTAPHYDSLATIILEHWRRRETINALTTRLVDANDRGESIDTVIRNIESDMREIAATGKSDIDELPLPPPDPRPVLRAEAYHGIVGEIVRKAAPETEADPVGVLIQHLIACGSVIGRTAHATVSGAKHYTNLFCNLVGPTGQGRKGSGWSCVAESMKLADLDWLEKRVGGGMSSGEGLMNRLRDASATQTDDGGTIVDDGEPDKRLLAKETEFGQVLRNLRRESNTLSAILRTAWDGDSIRTLTLKRPIVATGVRVSIIGHITEEELRRYIAEVDLFNGFANRFLWVMVQRSKILPHGGRFDLYQLGTELKDALAAAQRLDELERAAETREIWEDEYPRLTAPRPGLYGVVTGRAEAQTLRLSVLYAALDASPVIMPEHLRAALAVWDYCEQSARIIFGAEDAFDPLTKRILGLLVDAGDRGLTRKEISDRLGRNKASKDILTSLSLLSSRSRAKSQKINKPGSKKPVEWWYELRT